MLDTRRGGGLEDQIRGGIPGYAQKSGAARINMDAAYIARAARYVNWFGKSRARYESQFKKCSQGEASAFCGKVSLIAPEKLILPNHSKRTRSQVCPALHLLLAREVERNLLSGALRARETRESARSSRSRPPP